MREFFLCNHITSVFLLLIIIILLLLFYNSAVGVSEVNGSNIDEDSCVVKVTSIKLRGLKSGSLFGSANPYCTFSLGSHREKTDVKWGGPNDWIWKNTVLSFRTTLIKLQSYSLYIRVFDKERIRRKKLLGAVSIKLSGLEINGIQSWFALDGGGDIYLSIQIG